MNFRKALLPLVLIAALIGPLVASAQQSMNIPYQGVLSLGTCTGGQSCTEPVGDTPFNQAATTSLTQVIAAPSVATQKLRITALFATGEESATGGNLELETGTGTNCATNTAVLAVLVPLSASLAAGQQIAAQGNPLLIAPAGAAICVLVTAGTVTSANVSGVYTTY